MLGLDAAGAHADTALAASRANPTPSGHKVQPNCFLRNSIRSPFQGPLVVSPRGGGARDHYTGASEPSLILSSCSRAAVHNHVVKRHPDECDVPAIRVTFHETEKEAAPRNPCETRQQPFPYRMHLMRRHKKVAGYTDSEGDRKKQ